MAGDRVPSAATDDYDGCLCEHVRGHHAVISYLSGVHSTYCRWKGCGCPRFMPPKEADGA